MLLRALRTDVSPSYFFIDSYIKTGIVSARYDQLGITPSQQRLNIIRFIELLIIFITP